MDVFVWILVVGLTGVLACIAVGAASYAAGKRSQEKPVKDAYVKGYADGYEAGKDDERFTHKQGKWRTRDDY